MHASSGTFLKTNIHNHSNFKFPQFKAYNKSGSMFASLQLSMQVIVKNQDGYLWKKKEAILKPWDKKESTMLHLDHQILCTVEAHFGVYYYNSHWKLVF
jgi:hypothetical protein